MAIDKYLMAEMTWPELREVVRDGRVAVMPAGIIEQHGPQLHLNTDIFLAEPPACAGRDEANLGTGALSRHIGRLILSSCAPQVAHHRPAEGRHPITTGLGIARNFAPLEQPRVNAWSATVRITIFFENQHAQESRFAANRARGPIWRRFPPHSVNPAWSLAPAL